MRFEWTFRGPQDNVSVDRIRKIWTDDQFYLDFREQLNVQDHAFVVDGLTAGVRSRQELTFSTAGVPGIFRGLLGVGEAMTVTWLTEFPADSHEGEMKASTPDGKVSFAARTALQPLPEGVGWLVEGPVRLNAPWPIRGTAQAQLAGLLHGVLTDQAVVTERRLSLRPGPGEAPTG